MHNRRNVIECLWTDSRPLLGENKPPYSIGSRKWTNLTTCQTVVVWLGCTNNVCKNPNLNPLPCKKKYYCYGNIMNYGWCYRKQSQASCMAGQKSALSTTGPWWLDELRLNVRVRHLWPLGGVVTPIWRWENEGTCF